MRTRQCWRCGDTIDNERRVPSCDRCRDQLTERLALRTRRDAQRRQHAARLDRREIINARQRIDKRR